MLSPLRLLGVLGYGFSQRSKSLENGFIAHVYLNGSFLAETESSTSLIDIDYGKHLYSGRHPQNSIKFVLFIGYHIT